MTPRLKLMWQKSSRIGKDSFHLLSKLLGTKPSSNSARRDVLLQEAQQNNAVAISILKIDKEINLLKYYGVVEYVRSKNFLGFARNWLYSPSWLSLPWTSGAGGGGGGPKDLTLETSQSNCQNRLKTQDLSGTSGGGGAAAATTTAKAATASAGVATDRFLSTTSSNKKARVPFMITAAQRLILSNDLGYTNDQLKQLKPLEASLILKHGIHSNELDQQQLTVLVEEYHSFLVSEPSVDTDSITTSTTTTTTTTSTMNMESDRPESTLPYAGTLAAKAGDGESIKSNDSIASSSQRSSPPSSSSPPSITNHLMTTESISRVWFQVVGVLPDGTEQSVGIYPNESEAQLCQETKTHLANKHTPNDKMEFEIRRITQ